MNPILNRRSIRKFDLSKKIPTSELKELCRYAEAAPSARKQESREYIIVDDEAIIQELSSVSKGSMILTDCNTLLAVLGKNPDTLSVPHMQVQDLSAATENILLEATEKGYGNCWIGIYPIEDRVQKANEILQVKHGAFVFSLIALGYPLIKDCFYDAEKLKDENVHYNRY